MVQIDFMVPLDGFWCLIVCLPGHSRTKVRAQLGNTFFWCNEAPNVCVLLPFLLTLLMLPRVNISLGHSLQRYKNENPKERIFVLVKINPPYSTHKSQRVNHCYFPFWARLEGRFLIPKFKSLNLLFFVGISSMYEYHYSTSTTTPIIIYNYLQVVEQKKDFFCPCSTTST